MSSTNPHSTLHNPKSPALPSARQRPIENRKSKSENFCTRRTFLKQSTLTLGATLLAAKLPRLRAMQPAPPAPVPFPKFFDPCELVPLGKSKIKTSRLCLGTGTRGSRRQSDQTKLGTEKFNALIRGAYERGVRCFDLADLYGTHAPFAAAMKGIPRGTDCGCGCDCLAAAMKGIPRDTYTILTKLWFAPRGLPEPERPDAATVIARFLKELDTDYIDAVQLHSVTSPTWNTDLRPYMDGLAALKQKGIIRAHGVSCHSLAALQTAATEPWCDLVLARINPHGLAMDGPPEQVAPLLKQLHDAGKGVIGMKIFAVGKIRDDAEKLDACIPYALNLGTVDALNIGCVSLDEVDDIAARFQKVPRPTPKVPKS